MESKFVCFMTKGCVFIVLLSSLIGFKKVEWNHNWEIKIVQRDKNRGNSNKKNPKP